MGSLNSSTGSTASATTDVLPPEIIAAICAGIGMVMENEGDELAALIAAVILHSKGGGCRAVSFKRNSNAWSASGRQKIMDGRQMF